MKKIILLLAMVSASYTLNAQITTPQPSPATTIKQVVGLTDVTLEYSRPAMKGRTIFGDLVPYGRVWRTGANKNTVITFSDNVKIGGKDLKAGSYAIYTTPGESVWEINFYTDTNNSGVPQNWDASKVAAIVKANPTKTTEKVESFTIAINNLSDNGAHLEISWSDTKVAIPFEVPTDATVTSNITKIMNGPGAGDYYAAAVYYLSADKDITKAKEWIDKAMSMTEKPAYWQLRQQSLIYAKAGDKKGAIAAAKKSLAGAEEAKNMDYVKMNTDSLKEWGGM